MTAKKTTFAVYDTDLNPLGIMTWHKHEGERVLKIPVFLNISERYIGDDWAVPTSEPMAGTFALVEMVPLIRRTEANGERRGWVGITDRPDLIKAHLRAEDT